MIISLKGKIKNFIDRKIREIKNHQARSQQIVLDYEQISKLFPESHFIPFTTWSISPSVILHIVNDIVINKRRHVIEFGTGASTLYIARLIQTLKLDIKFYSIESDGEWLENIDKQLNLYGLQGIVSLVHAPLGNVPSDIRLNNQQLWYDTEIIARETEAINKVDLVIVDGPSGSSTPFARYSAIPFLQDRLAEKFGVFLDDSRREDEMEITKKWAGNLNVTPQSFERYTYFTNNEEFAINPFKVSSL